MLFDSDFWDDYFPALYSVDSAEERFQVYEDYILALGFSGATYTFTPRIQLEAMPELPLIFLHTRDYPVAFLQEYQERMFDKEGYDFTVNKMSQGCTEVMDWREWKNKGELDDKELYLIQLAEVKYNIKNGISIPTMLDERGGAGMSVISYEENDKFQSIKQKRLRELLSATRLFHEANFTDVSKFILPIFKSLSKTEILVLQYKANGNTMKNIGDHLDISHGAACNLLTQLRRRLGGINNDRLMYLFGLLTNLNNIPMDVLPELGGD